MTTIVWTPAKAKLLRVQFEIARHDGKDSFEFEGHTFVTDYAKYLLQYLDGRFK